jgi:hypothetical protein
MTAAAMNTIAMITSMRTVRSIPVIAAKST